MYTILAHNILHPGVFWQLKDPFLIWFRGKGPLIQTPAPAPFTTHMLKQSTKCRQKVKM